MPGTGSLGASEAATLGLGAGAVHGAALASAVDVWEVGESLGEEGGDALSAVVEQPPSKASTVAVAASRATVAPFVMDR
jgi:hypothetical protein